VKGNLIQAKAADVGHKSGRLTIPAEHLTSMLLARLLVDVDRFEKSTPVQGTRRVVLSVPPGVPMTAVKALNQAAALAGYEVLSTVYDVTCASLVYAHRLSCALTAEKEKAKTAKKGAGAPEAAAAAETGPQTVAFLDMGHDWASVQVCIVDAAAKRLRVLATKSSPTCGAAAFGQALVDMWIKELREKHKIDVSKLSGAARDRSLMRLLSQAEKTKNMLSGLPEVAVVVDSVVPDFDLKVVVSSFPPAHSDNCIVSRPRSPERSWRLRAPPSWTG
jgi:molecular chaperone DnaK (HSP70)